MVKSRMQRALKATPEQPIYAGLELDENAAEERLREQEAAEERESELLNGLTRRQRHFVLEKLMGHCDKDAALLAGYSLSVAENTKQRVWKPPVRVEFERLARKLAKLMASKVLQEPGMVGKG